MNKQLLTATLVAISSIAYANTETPNYDFMAIDSQQYCEQNQTELCKEIAALFVTARELMTEEQLKKADELHAALAQEIAQTREIGIKKEEGTVNLEEDQKKAEELVDQLNAQN